MIQQIIKYASRRMNNSRLWLSECISAKDYGLLLYSFSGVLFLTALILQYFVPTKGITIILYATLVFLSLGYLWRATRFINSLIPSGIRNVLLGLFHTAIIIVSVAVSRTLIAFIIGLPPQDYELTVTAISLCVYPIILSVFMAAMSAIAMIFVLLFGLINSIRNVSLRNVIFLGDHFGAIVFISLIIGGLSQLGKHGDKIEYITKYAAYYCDYHTIRRYPNIPKDLQIHIHDSGIISYAKKSTNNSIDIGILQAKDSALTTGAIDKK